MASAQENSLGGTFQQMTLVDILDDLTVRFLLNLPPAELSSVPRLCFQVEEAQWFYEDFIRPLNPTLPSLNLRSFLLTLFQHCPLLSGFDAAQHVAAYEQFLEYKTRVPVRGAILMNHAMDKVLLVRGWKKGASWSFPRGKINKDEDDLDCAIREVYEETGFDATSLVEDNRQQDGKVKAIDVTMREQHMRLFVFRGVSMDTHFEPRTRKEISKIQWYNVKDLPGFKKQKGVAGVGQGEAQATKFYMVAPFLGQLKKWIGQQRRNDAINAQVEHGRSLSTAQIIVQAGEEEETEQEHAVDDGTAIVGTPSEELKKLLSIGGSSVPSPPLCQSSPATTYSNAQTNNLLAMLKGSQPSLPISGAIPHTPMEQIDPSFPQKEPETPQPHHPRQPSFPQVPPFAYSPQRLQQEQRAQRNYSVPNQGYTGLSNMPPHLQQQMFNQQPRQHNMPNYFTGQAPSSVPAQQHRPSRPSPVQRPNLASPMQSYRGKPSVGAYDTSYPQTEWLARAAQQALNTQLWDKAAGSEPSMPEASMLPQPKLPPQTQLLLDVFKTTKTKPQANGTSVQDSTKQKHSSQQATALLTLFRKPSAQASSQPAAEDVPAPASPAVSDVTVKPNKEPERMLTLNEITRTLPARPKTKSPKPVMQTASPAQARSPVQKAVAEPPAGPSISAAIPPEVVVDRPRSRGKLFDPANPKPFVRPASQTNKQEQPRHSPKPRTRPATPKAQNAHPPPQFSILQRPSSSRSPVPQSPLRYESPSTNFQTQVLRRSEDAAPEATAPANGKRDQLLSLFGKSPPAPSPRQITSTSAPKLHAEQALSRSPQPQPLFVTTTKTPEPPQQPPTPQLQPDRKPLRHAGHSGTGQQQLLLNLFHRPGSSMGSPGTPISPFTLEAPATKAEPRSRLGSMTSLKGAGSGRQTPTNATPTSATPTEQSKGFLLSYLNGVVEKEGYRGIKK